MFSIYPGNKNVQTGLVVLTRYFYFVCGIVPDGLNKRIISKIDQSKR